MNHFPIAIIGAGLGGLTTARVLEVNGVPSAVFEMESDRRVRTQGGMLDIHRENGQRAIHAAALWTQFQELIHEGGDATRVLDRHGIVHLDDAGDSDLERPEVERGRLRELLLDSVRSDSIHWDHKVVDVRPAEAAGRHVVEFANGTAITTDLLIGADGAWSRVRRLLSAAHPAYTGISFVEGTLFDADERHPVEAQAVGAGMVFALDGDTGILGHRESGDRLHVYLGHRSDEQWLDTIDFADESAAKTAILGLLQGWSDALRGLIANADTSLTPRRIHALPVGHSWKRVPGVTLLGDAAHVMSPFAGEGANLAMYDGALLALSIAEHPGDIEAALGAYEALLFPRSADAAAQSAENLEVVFAPGAPRGLLKMFERFRPEETHELLEQVDN